jgi:hypothetical protein
MSSILLDSVLPKKKLWTSHLKQPVRAPCGVMQDNSSQFYLVEWRFGQLSKKNFPWQPLGSKKPEQKTDSVVLTMKYCEMKTCEKSYSTKVYHSLLHFSTITLE